MINEIFFYEFFHNKKFKNLNFANDEMQFQRIIKSFMIFVKVNKFYNKTDYIFINNFYDYVDHEQM